jgi:thiamine biosynthesis protein ThiS
MKEQGTVIANGEPVSARVPIPIADFLVSLQLLPRSVVVELDGEAIAPSEFSKRLIQNGSRIEIVKIVAGG